MSSAHRVAALSFEAFDAAAVAWNELLASSARPLPFLSHGWLRVWWRCFGGGSTFVAPAVYDGSRMLAALPLALRPTRIAGWPLTVAEVVGTAPVPTRGQGLADKVGLLVRRDAPEAGAQLLQSLFELRPAVAVLDLKGLDQTSAVATDGGKTRRLPHSVSPFLALEGSWEGYLSSRSRNFRKHLKKYHRLLGQEGPVVIERLERPQDHRRFMEEVVSLNEASWKGRRGTNLFRHPAIRSFLLQLTAELLRDGQLDLRLLRVGERAVAYELCFDLGGRLFSYNGAFVEELRQASPGTVLTAEVIRSAFERGYVEYDMLRGAEEYKLRWSPTEHREQRLVVSRGGAPADLYSAWVGMKSRLKSCGWLAEVDDRLSGLWTRLKHPEVRDRERRQ